jgi:signal transduction histidine kinase
MTVTTAELEEVGLEVVDVGEAACFPHSAVRARAASLQIEAVHRLAAAFVERPEIILQELVEAAVRLCGADSAGISIEREDRTPESYYQWVATAGDYSSFLNASLPVFPSACTVCLERGRPQRFRVNRRFFDLIGVEAAPVTDGILLPWEVEGIRGTIFVIAHGRAEAFDAEDLRLMQVLAEFAAMGVRNHQQQRKLLAQARSAAAAAMANDLAHQINNPLQSLANLLYLATQSEGAEAALATKLTQEFERLSALVKELLALPQLQVT